MTETQITIEEEQAGQRVDAFVAAHLNVSRSRAQKLLEGATLNQARVKPSHVLKLGDVLQLLEQEPDNEETRAQIASENMPMPELIKKLVFVYEDEHLMIINKPRGLLVHLGAGERVATLVDFLRQQNKPLSTVGPPERAGIVHRLDKDTSGLIIVCKTDAAHWKLAEDFAHRRLTKNYIALVCGVPPLRGRIEAPIERHATHRKKFAVVPHGKDAITEYTVTQHWRKFALLDVNLLTGRTHQIRVHLNYLNHPIAGDPLYGGEKRALDSAGSDEVRAALQQLDGQALHAAKLEFTHPITDAPLQFEAPMPADMQNVIEALNAAE
ncbi:MAG TPA: RluA family pseudouridine synthase [Abditibacteriaceae bacterium]|jgi:23S rRNA pseudouridine1911/1915/1917 synthase